MSSSETSTFDTVEQVHQGSEADDQWWRDAEFTVRPKPLTNRLNARLQDCCAELQSIFETSRGSSADDAVAKAIRRDTVAATRVSVRRDLVQSTIQWGYAWVRSLGVLVAAVFVALSVGRGPAWLDIVLIVAVTIFSVSLLIPTPSADDFTLWAFFAGGGAFIALIVRPIAGIGIWEGVGAASVAVVATMLILLLTHLLLVRFWNVSSSLVALVVLIALTFAVANFVDIDPLPQWLRFAFEAILIGGLGGAIGLGLLQFSTAAFRRLEEARKLRAIPESEFVQSILWLIGGVQPPKAAAAVTSPVTREYKDRWHVLYEGFGEPPWDRGQIVGGIQYLATVLERGVQAEIAREDPASIGVLANRFEQSYA